MPGPKRAAIQRRLLAWYRQSCRDLPWRHTRDPYRIWLSETMLQQTRVETVIPYYERFTARFPSVEALALADEQDVLREWAGLGYYARARNLKHAAECIVRDHAGTIPREAERLASLPGVGRYTVGAIRSIAFREPAPIVDGNVRRVLSRLLGQTHLREAELWQIAEQLVPQERPDQFNQALMELGATFCLPRRPGCKACPVKPVCQAWRSGHPEQFPQPGPRAKPRALRALAGALEQHGRLLLVRRPSEGWLGGLWEIPTTESHRIPDLRADFEARTGLRTRVTARLGRVHHVFSHRTLTLEVVRLERVSGRLRRACGACWCSGREAARLPLSRLTHKALAHTTLKLPAGGSVPAAEVPDHEKGSDRRVRQRG